MLAVLFARFHTHFLLSVLTTAKRTHIDTKKRLKKTAKKDLLFWRPLGPEDRYMLQNNPLLCTHSDAADLGWGNTFSAQIEEELNVNEAQGAWSPGERVKTIS